MADDIPVNDGRARSGDEVWDSLVLDEDFVRGAETTEPSAWRSDEPPAGWFFSKARRRKWRRR